MLSATSPAVRIASGQTTVPDGNGNNLFGGTTLEGFVLDQNQYNSGNFLPSVATAAQFGQATVNYAFNQPVTATALPANVGTNRPALNESGYFGGIMTHTTNPTTGSPYVLAGVVSPLQSSPLSNNRLAATFTGSDPFTASQSGISSMVLNFGSLLGGTPTRGVYIDNNIYAATDSGETQSSINGNLLPLPQNSTTAAPSPSIALVSSGTVPSNSWMPAG